MNLTPELWPWSVALHTQKRNRFCIPREVSPCVQSSREPHNSRLEQVEWYLPPTSPSVYFVPNTCCLSAGKWEGKTQEEWTVYVGVQHTRINCQCGDKSSVFFLSAIFHQRLQSSCLQNPASTITLLPNQIPVSIWEHICGDFTPPNDLCIYLSAWHLPSNFAWTKGRQLTKISASINTLYQLSVWKTRIMKKHMPTFWRQ